MDSSAATTTTYDADGSLTLVQSPSGFVTMSYDKERRLVQHQEGTVRVTYTYSGDGLKRSERQASGTTTLVWDGNDYLQERS